MADNKPSYPTLTTQTWANDTNIASGPQIGQTTKLQPSNGYLAAGAVPGRSIPGRYMNWLFNTLLAWCYYLGDLHNQLQFLNKSYTWITGTHTFSTATNFLSDIVGSGDVYVPSDKNYLYSGLGHDFEIAVPLTGVAAAGGVLTWEQGVDGAKVSLVAGAIYEVSLKGIVNVGMNIMQVRAACVPAGAGLVMGLVARGTGAGGVAAEVDPTDPSRLTASVADSDTSSGTSAQVLNTGTIAGTGVVVNDGTEYVVRFVSSATPGDELRWLVLNVKVFSLRGV